MEIISLSISMKVWDWARIELATLGSAIRQASTFRHVTNCAKWLGLILDALCHLLSTSLYLKQGFSIKEICDSSRY